MGRISRLSAGAASSSAASERAMRPRTALDADDASEPAPPMPPPMSAPASALCPTAEYSFEPLIGSSCSSSSAALWMPA
jgi:hypothetical protein